MAVLAKKRMLPVLILLAAMITLARADVFERVRPADTAIRDHLVRDRADFYFSAPGLDLHETQTPVSGIKALSTGEFTRARGLRDMDKAYDLYLAELLSKERDHKALVNAAHPLVLLEYSSPVLADVVKHYRISAYERLAIERARLSDVDRATVTTADGLSRQSERDCLRRNESRGLVAAMRICQSAPLPFEGLAGIGGDVSLEDGRRKFHVLAQALGRLGLDAPRIRAVTDIAGDDVVTDGSFTAVLPAVTFDGRLGAARQDLIRQWQELLREYNATGRPRAARMEKLSLPGVPVTAGTCAALELLEAHAREMMILKFASAAGYVATARAYRQAAEYLTLCLADPALPRAYRELVTARREFLCQAPGPAERSREEGEMYQDLLVALSSAEDEARERLAGKGTVAAARRSFLSPR